MSGFGEDKNPFNMNNKMTQKERADVVDKQSRDEYKKQQRVKNERLDNEARYKQIKKPETIEEYYETNIYLKNKSEVIKDIKNDLVMKDYRYRGNTGDIYRPSDTKANAIYDGLVRINKLTDYEKENFLQKQLMDKFKTNSDDEAYDGYYSDDYNSDEYDYAEEMRKDEEEERERNEEGAMFEEYLNTQAIIDAEKAENKKISAKEQSDATITTNEDRITNRKTKLKDRMKQRMKSRIEAEKTPEQRAIEARKAKLTEALQNNTLNHISEEDARLMGLIKDNDDKYKLYTSSRFPDNKYVKTINGTIWINNNTKIKRDDETIVLLNDLLNETTGGKKTKKGRRTKKVKKTKKGRKTKKVKKTKKGGSRKTYSSKNIPPANISMKQIQNEVQKDKFIIRVNNDSKKFTDLVKKTLRNKKNPTIGGKRKTRKSKK